MSLLDKVRQRQSLPAAPKAAELAPKPSKKPKPAEAKPEVPAGTVKFKCGHEGEPGVCGACRSARNDRRKEKRKAKKAAKQAAGLPLPNKPRLPGGSTFAATYDAASETWTGTLTIDGRTFEATAGGVKKLCYALDDLYRASLAPPQQ